MAVTNYERIGRGMELLRTGLAPFVEREYRGKYRERWLEEARNRFPDDRMVQKPFSEWDVSILLKLMWEGWNDVFRSVLGFAERSLVSELRDWRNKWAHQESFSSDDTDRALDSMTRLLTSVSAKEADDTARMKMELRRLVFEEQVRGEKRKAGGSLIEVAAAGTLKPWREVIVPHADVASGRYQQAEFAADLWQVHLGEGASEYREPKEFFRRTFLTESLKRLLAGGIQRLTGKGGDPVVQLQTNFGGGKTHSMLALYHLFSGTAPGELAGVEEIMAESGETSLPSVNKVVIVGNRISPGNPVTKTDGTVVRTLWGEIAWQLGGARAYERVKADDERGTNPGDTLRSIFKEYGPCLILVDEWVAYARQLHDRGDLPAGDFETQFSFAQALTESAKLAKNCLLVISLPASDTTDSPRESGTDDVEVGGIRGREALDRLRNVVGRLESSWRPASAEEGFEIVRRRLFEPLPNSDAYKHRDVTARAFAELYRAQSSEFPSECREGEYEARIKSAYPIHPEIFDRLYTDWSTLVKFQRTRGVLRLMAAVIHSLWDRGDKSPLILPSMIPLDDNKVQFELTRYLSDNWVPIIEKDVDGPNSLPVKLDGENPSLGKHSAARRVARTIYMGSAPIQTVSHRGIEDRRVKLGCVLPGESPAVFGDGLRRLASSATYLYQDENRLWYSTQPTVTKLAEDRAEQYRRNPDKVIHELEERLQADLRKNGGFSRIHTMPKSGVDVTDDHSARLVVLSAEYPYARGEESAAIAAAKSILNSRGASPRIYRNTLLFLAADKTRLQDLDDALRKYLAWESILAEKEGLNLDPHQVRQAEIQKRAADDAVNARLPETYQWLLVPEQETPSSTVTWQSLRLTSGEGLAVRAGKKLQAEEALLTSIGAAVLRQEMDKIPLWRGNHVSVRQLIEDFASYIYLRRLSGREVIEKAVKDGAEYLLWRSDTFAYADGYDESAGRYIGLRAGRPVTISTDSGGLVVRPEAAEKQFEEEARGNPVLPGDTVVITPGDDNPVIPRRGGDVFPVPQPEPDRKTRRFHGTVTLDSDRVGRDASRIAEEVISHLAGLIGADVSVTLEIQATVPDGVPENVVRAVTENSKTLKFSSHGFESE